MLSASLAWVDWRSLACDAIATYEADHAGTAS